MELSMIEWLILINGVYDIICTIAILSDFVILKSFGELHSKMFKEKNGLMKRILGYWIFTYGCIRIAILTREEIVYKLVLMTYVVESGFLILEDIIYKTTVTWRVMSVSLMCGMICAMISLR
jgi:hypothetical protein